MANTLINPKAEHSQALYALAKKRADVGGQIEQKQAELRKLNVDLNHIDAAINLFDPDFKIGLIRSKPAMVPHAAFRGEITRAVVRTIHETKGRPFTAHDVVARLIKQRGADPNDKVMRTLLLRRVRACLRMHRRSGLLRHAGPMGSLQGWAAVE